MADMHLLRDLAVEQGYVGAGLDRRLLAAATLGGAQALNMDAAAGSLEPGKRADFAVFAIDASNGDVERRVVAEGASACIATVVAGNVRYDAAGESSIG